MEDAVQRAVILTEGILDAYECYTGSGESRCLFLVYRKFVRVRKGVPKIEVLEFLGKIHFETGRKKKKSCV